MVLALKAQPQVATFGQTLKGAPLQQRASSGRVAAAAPVQAATQKLKARPAPAKPAAKPAAKTVVVAKPVAKPAAKPAAKTVVVSKPAAAKKPAGTVKLSVPANGTTKKTVTGTVKLGTSPTKKLSAVPMFESDKTFRPKQVSGKPAPKILARVEELRLLSKLEKAGLLSAIEKSGLTLSAIEKSGLLSKAESLGLISAAADRNTPSALFTLATVLLAAGPALVYFTPDDSTALVALQVVGALVCVAGGAAAYGGASLLSSLQK